MSSTLPFAFRLILCLEILHVLHFFFLQQNVKCPFTLHHNTILPKFCSFHFPSLQLHRPLSPKIIVPQLYCDLLLPKPFLPLPNPLITTTSRPLSPSLPSPLLQVLTSTLLEGFMKRWVWEVRGGWLVFTFNEVISWKGSIYKDIFLVGELRFINATPSSMPPCGIIAFE